MEIQVTQKKGKDYNMGNAKWSIKSVFVCNIPTIKTVRLQELDRKTKKNLPTLQTRFVWFIKSTQDSFDYNVTTVS